MLNDAIHRHQKDSARRMRKDSLREPIGPQEAHRVIGEGSPQLDEEFWSFC
jgi:hypothetical protein